MPNPTGPAKPFLSGPYLTNARPNPPCLSCPAFPALPCCAVRHLPLRYPNEPSLSCHTMSDRTLPDLVTPCATWPFLPYLPDLRLPHETLPFLPCHALHGPRLGNPRRAKPIQPRPYLTRPCPTRTRQAAPQLPRLTRPDPASPQRTQADRNEPDPNCHYAPYLARLCLTWPSLTFPAMPILASACLAVSCPAGPRLSCVACPRRGGPNLAYPAYTLASTFLSLPASPATVRVASALFMALKTTASSSSEAYFVLKSIMSARASSSS